MNNTPLKEGEDYYFNEEGLVVMTEKFLKKRGFCCKNNCRHCLYKENRDNSSR